MILAVDVHYNESSAGVGVVGFEHWNDSEPTLEYAAESAESLRGYEPGAFYQRELPHLLSVLRPILNDAMPEFIVVDAHVWLGPQVPGLGTHLYGALAQQIPVIGVAKTAYRGAPTVPVLRPGSRRPLYVTSAGMPADDAARRLTTMHGAHRIPTLLRLVDQLARGVVEPTPRTSPSLTEQ